MIRRPQFQFTVAAMLRATLLFAVALGSWAVFLNHREELTNTERIAVALLTFGGIGAAVGTLIGRAIFGGIVGLVVLVILLLSPS